MSLSKLQLACVAAVSTVSLAMEGAPAVAGGCGYYGCGVIVQPQPYVYQPCSCGTYGNGYGYGDYAPGYTYPLSYGGYSGYGGYGGYGRGFYGRGAYGGGVYRRGFARW
jgi:hypothetical protein